MSHGPAPTPTWWVLGGFQDADKLLAAGRRLREMGYRNLDSYSPYPLHGAEEALGISKSKVPLVVFAAGVTGACLGFLLQYFCQVIDYPINVAGRPLLSWPQWIPVTFECGILMGAFGAFLSVFAFSGLPRPHHPVFEVEGFRRANIDRFWLSVHLETPKEEDRDRITKELESLGAYQVSVVEDIDS